MLYLLAQSRHWVIAVLSQGLPSHPVCRRMFASHAPAEGPGLASTFGSTQNSTRGIASKDCNLAIVQQQHPGSLELHPVAGDLGSHGNF